MSKRRKETRPRRGLLPLGILAGTVLLALGAVVVLAAASPSTRRSGSGMTALSAAKVAFVDGDFDRAEEFLRALGDNVEAQVLLGRVLLERGRLSEAQEILSQVIKADPENFEATRSLARVYKRQGQLDLAIMTFSRATQLRKDDASVWREMGLAQREKGDSYGALSSIQQSLSLDKDQADLSGLVTELAMGKNSRTSIPGMQGFGMEGFGGSREHGRFGASAFDAASRIPRPDLPNPAGAHRPHTVGLPR